MVSLFGPYLGLARRGIAGGVPIALDVVAGVAAGVQQLAGLQLLGHRLRRGRVIKNTI